MNSIIAYQIFETKLYYKSVDVQNCVTNCIRPKVIYVYLIKTNIVFFFLPSIFLRITKIYKMSMKQLCQKRIHKEKQYCLYWLQRISLYIESYRRIQTIWFSTQFSLHFPVSSKPSIAMPVCIVTSPIDILFVLCIKKTHILTGERVPSYYTTRSHRRLDETHRGILFSGNENEIIANTFRLIGGPRIRTVITRW